MDKASTVGADRAGAYWGFVDFFHQVEVSKQVRSILLGPVANVVGSVPQSIVPRPLVDLCVEVERGFVRVGFRYLDIGCGVGDTFVYCPADIFIGVNADWP
jgi:hypothetical protein